MVGKGTVTKKLLWEPLLEIAMPILAMLKSINGRNRETREWNRKAGGERTGSKKGHQCTDRSEGGPDTLKLRFWSRDSAAAEPAYQV